MSKKAYFLQPCSTVFQPCSELLEHTHNVFLLKTPFRGLRNTVGGRDGEHGNRVPDFLPASAPELFFRRPRHLNT